MENYANPDDFLKIADLIVTPLIIVNKASPQDEHLYFNKAFVNEIGYTIDSTPNLCTWFEQAYPDADYRKEIVYYWNKRKIIAEKYGHAHFHLEARIFCADESYCWYDIYETQLDGLAVLTFLNINDLERKNEQLTNTIKRKNLLLSIITHDVRNPLLNIKMLLDDVLLKKHDLEKSKFDKIAAELGPRLDQAINLVNSSLLRIGIERGVFVFEPELIDLVVFFNKLYEDIKPGLHGKNIKLTFKLQDSKTIFYDRFILEIAVVNIMNFIIRNRGENGEITFLNVDKKDFTSLIITAEGVQYSWNRKTTAPYGNSIKIEELDSSGLLPGTQKIIDENGARLITHRKQYCTAWEIRVKKQDAL